MMFKAFMLLVELKAFMSTSLNFNIYAYIVYVTTRIYLIIKRMSVKKRQDNMLCSML